MYEPAPERATNPPRRLPTGGRRARRDDDMADYEAPSADSDQPTDPPRPGRRAAYPPGWSTGVPTEETPEPPSGASYRGRRAAYPIDDVDETATAEAARQESTETPAHTGWANDPLAPQAPAQSAQPGADLAGPSTYGAPDDAPSDGQFEDPLGLPTSWGEETAADPTSAPPEGTATWDTTTSGWDTNSGLDASSGWDTDSTAPDAAADPNVTWWESDTAAMSGADAALASAAPDSTSYSHELPTLSELPATTSWNTYGAETETSPSLELPSLDPSESLELPSLDPSESLELPTLERSPAPPPPEPAAAQTAEATPSIEETAWYVPEWTTGDAATDQPADTEAPSADVSSVDDLADADQDGPKPPWARFGSAEDVPLQMAARETAEAESAATEAYEPALGRSRRSHRPMWRDEVPPDDRQPPQQPLSFQPAVRRTTSRHYDADENESTERPAGLPGWAAAVIGMVTALGAGAFDLFWTGQVAIFFTICFVVVAFAIATSIRRTAFFTALVLPPFQLLATMVTLGIAAPERLNPAAGSRFDAIYSALAGSWLTLVAAVSVTAGMIVIRWALRPTRPEPEDDG